MAAPVSLDAETVRRLMHTSSAVLCNTKGAREGKKRKRGRETKAAKRGGKGQDWMHRTGWMMKCSVVFVWHVGQFRSTSAGLNFSHLLVEASCSVLLI